MNNNRYVLFFDSGIGGITILKSFLDLKKNVNVIYYADTINFPYGDKEEIFIGKVLHNVYLNLIKEYNIDLISIVCNTASVAALQYLREKIKNIQIIGTVPAVKPASELTENNKIGIIATEATVKLQYLNNLVNKYAQDKNVIIKASSKLTDACENFYDEKQIKKIIKNELSGFKYENIDVLVLGCTHYSFIKQEINDFFENKVKVIDSIDGLTNRIMELLPKDMETDDVDKILILSKGDEGIKEKYENLNDRLNIFNRIIVEDMSCLKE